MARAAPSKRKRVHKARVDTFTQRLEGVLCWRDCKGVVGIVGARHGFVNEQQGRVLDDDGAQTGHVAQVVAGPGTRDGSRVKGVLGREQVVQGKEAAAQRCVLGQQRLAGTVPRAVLDLVRGRWLRNVTSLGLRQRQRLLLLCNKPADGKVVGDGRAERVDELGRVLGDFTENIEVKLRLGEAKVVGSKLCCAFINEVLEEVRAAEDFEELLEDSDDDEREKQKLKEGTKTQTRCSGVVWLARKACSSKVMGAPSWYSRAKYCS